MAGSLTANLALRTMSEHRVDRCMCPMDFTIEYEPEEDGRWLAELPQFPGVLA